MSVVIIDYGMGNLASVKRALEECGADVIISDNPSDLKTADKIILPWVGSFADGMENLKKGAWIEVIRKEVIENKIPILGICLGMQLLASTWYEWGEIAWLDLIPWIVRKLESENKEEKIPHVGRNEIEIVKENQLLEKIPNWSDFYFVHSYVFDVTNKENILAYTPYCGKFVSIVNKDNIYGTQFHPEKSMPTGFQLLRNFLNI
jgi:imidazole glycerol-phosphate synthase subunit HisH